MSNEEYKSLFLSESRDIIKDVNNKMVELEKDPSNQDVINTIFRGAHTIKGMSATMGYDPIVKLAHSMESLLSLVREGRLKAERNIIDLLFKGIDSLEEGIDAVDESNGKGINYSALVEKLKKAAESAGAKKEDAGQTCPVHIASAIDKVVEDKLAQAVKNGPDSLAGRSKPC